MSVGVGRGSVDEGAGGVAFPCCFQAVAAPAAAATLGQITPTTTGAVR